MKRACHVIFSRRFGLALLGLAASGLICGATSVRAGSMEDLMLNALAAPTGVVIRNDDFSSDTLSDYTALGINLGTDKPASGYNVSGGVLNAVRVSGNHGMLAIEDGSGGLYATPDHFRIAFSYLPLDDSINNDHPGIAFDGGASSTNVFYVRTHSNQAVAGRTNGSSISPNSTMSTSGLSVENPYDFVFEVDYLNQVATVDVFDTGGSSLATESFTGTGFANMFGTTNNGGPFGVMFVDTEGAAIDNLVVTDLTLSPPDPLVPEPSTTALFSLALTGLAFWTWRQRRGRSAIA